MSSEAAPFVCAGLVFGCAAGVPAAVITEAIASVLGNAVIPSDIRKVGWESGLTFHRGLVRPPAFIRRLRLRLLAWTKARMLNSEPAFLKCCVSLCDFIADICQFEAPAWKRAAEREEPAVAFWHDLRVNLCANDCGSRGETLDAHSRSSHSAALSPSKPTVPVLTRLSLAHSGDIRQ